jgi:hypothetical protein
MKKLFAAIIVISIIAGCSHTPKTPPADSEQEEKKDSTVKDTAIVKNYFPVKDYLKGEIAKTEAYFTAFHQFVTRGNKVDSSYIEPDAFKKLAAEFTTDDLTKAALEKDFKENAFLDNTTNSYTFNYATTNSSLPVQRVDVIAVPGDAYDKIKSIYIEKWGMQGKISYFKKMYWKIGKSFQVITSLNTTPSKTENIKIVWNE